MDESGSAFPRVDNSIDKGTSGANVDHHGDPGMTLRDYFAAKAMIAVMDDWRSTRGRIQQEGFDECVSPMASEAYLMADAMVKARET